MTLEPDHRTAVAPHRTAIERVGTSRPISVALADGIITNRTTVFDYGCGRGGDLRLLRANGIHAIGWDPYFAPHEKIVSADVVNLGYVLNVIERVAERVHTLRRACELAREVLVVAVRIEQGIGDIPELRDGFVTERGTFQKYYSQQEFLDFVQDALSCRMHVPALGVGYVFKSPETEQRYVATKAYSRRLEFRRDLVEEFRRNALATRYVQLANELGRMPDPAEFEGYGDLVSAYGSPVRVQRLASTAVSQDTFAAAREDRRSDMLVFAALLRLQGIPAPGSTRYRDRCKRTSKHSGVAIPARCGRGNKSCSASGIPNS